MDTPLSLLLNRAQRAIRRRASLKATSNLASLQAGVLFVLESPDGVGFGEVARTLKTTAPRLSEVVHRMAEADLITRLADPNDGRAQSLVLTSKGRKTRSAALRALADLDALMTESFTTDEICTVVRWLQSVQKRCDNVVEVSADSQTSLI